MPKLVRFVIVNTLIGVVIGWFVAAGVIYFNVFGFGDVLMHSQSKLVAIFILAMSFGVTFGFGFLTTAVLLMPTNKDEFDRL